MIKENTIKEGLQKGIGIFKNIISKEIKMVPLSKLQINDEYQAVFTQEGEKIKRIAEDIKVNGFDKTQPIVVLPDFTIVDGHTRYFAAQEIEKNLLGEINPYINLEIDSQ
jgi:ParB-like chromosome segregation protein Spo0J